MTLRTVTLAAPDGLPEIRPGDDLAALALAALEGAGQAPADGDVFVLAQKVVSKSEGRTVRLADIAPRPEAARLARETGKEPELVELILRESVEIVRTRPGLIVARHRNGCVVANAGVDRSNSGGAGVAVLLPEDADRSAARLRARLEGLAGLSVAVVINDSMGRAWRSGTVGTAIGASGLETLRDARGDPDRDGRPLRTSVIAVADEIAAAASLLMGQGREGRPFVLARGCAPKTGDGGAAGIVRPRELDLFR